MQAGHRWSGLMLGALLVAASASLMAQKVVDKSVGGGGSPHETVEWTIDGAKLTVSYGRPFIKGRTLSQVAPDGEIYRLGADEATKLTTDKNLMFGSLMVPPGSYSLFAEPKGGKWELIINKQTGQPGTKHDAAQDFGRTPLTFAKGGKANENFTITFEDTKDGGVLTFQWGAEKLSTPFMVH